MRAVQVTRTDGPGAVQVGEVPDPVRGDEEILVEMRAAGVNFPDLLLTKDMYQYKPELPFVLGGEFAGVVREAPAGSEFSPGDRVAGSATVGAFAELVSLPARNVYPLPGKVDSSRARACR